MTKKYIKPQQRHIYSTPRLNFALSVIKQKSGKPYNVILSEIAEPLAEMIGNFETAATFYVMPSGNTITIVVSGKNPFVHYGQNQPIQNAFCNEDN